MSAETSGAGRAEDRTRTDAQGRADRIAAFRAEVEELSREGVPLDRATLAAVAAHHDTVLRRLAHEFDVDTTPAAKRMSRGMQVASLLGAAALVAAIVSFVYRVWGSLTLPSQVAMVTAAPLLGTAGALIAGRLERSHYVASIFAIAACAGFVLQTLVLGQLFNLRGSVHATGAWAAFALAVSVPSRYAIPFAWAVAAAIAYLSGLMMMAFGSAWTSFPRRPETMMASGAVILVASLWWAQPFRSIARPIALVAVLAPMLVLSSSGSPSGIGGDPQTVRLAYQFLATVSAAGIIAAGLRFGWKDAVVVGCTFAALFILTRFIDWWWDWMPKYLFFLIVAAVAVVSLWLLRVARRRFEAPAE